MVASVLTPVSREPLWLADLAVHRAPLASHIEGIRSDPQLGFLLVLGLSMDTGDAQELVDLVAEHDNHAAILWERSGYSVDTAHSGLRNVTELHQILTLNPAYSGHIATATNGRRPAILPAGIPDLFFGAASRISDMPSKKAVYFGRNSPSKNLTVLARHWSTTTFPSTGVELELYLVGADVTDARLLSGPGVSVHGAVSSTERADLMHLATAVVFASRYDHLPQVLLEAMASGAFCVVSDIPGHSAVAHGVSGLRFDLEDLTSLDDAVAHAARDPKDVRDMRRKASIWCASHHGQKHARDTLMALDMATR
jgi:glycosyltransferase involved in cell wall biosynthesis